MLKQNVLNNMTMIDLKQQNYERAIFRAGEALKLGINPKALYRRAVAYMEVGDLDSAKADLDAASREMPNDAGIRREQKRLGEMFKAQYNKQKKELGGFLK